MLRYYLSIFICVINSDGWSIIKFAPLSKSSCFVLNPQLTPIANTPAFLAVCISIEVSPKYKTSFLSTPVTDNISFTIVGLGLAGIPSLCPNTTAKLNCLK